MSRYVADYITPYLPLRSREGVERIAGMPATRTAMKALAEAALYYLDKHEKVEAQLAARIGADLPPCDWWRE